MRRRASGSPSAPQLDIPVLDVAKAKRYNRARLAFLGLSTIWSLTRLAWLAADRRALRLRGRADRYVPDRRLRAPAFFAIVTALGWLASLPLGFLGGHLVERRFGLTTQSGRGWLLDQVKALLVSLTIQPPLLTLAYVTIRRRPRDWWLILAAGAVPLIVVFANLAPVLLMPLFNRIVPLRDEAMADRLRQLALRGGVSISDVYEIDMSRQSEKPNAMFAGLGNTKRIALGDTLLERFPSDEIDAVVAHELAHQVHGDVWRLIGFGAGSGFFAAWMVGKLMPAVIRLTRLRTGVDDLGNEASLPVLALVASAVGLVLMPLQAAFSRSIERRADQFAIALTGDRAAYARALRRLAAQSLADPDPPMLVVLFLYSHPPVAERILAATAAS
jgi:STE24 endopeptidase